MTKKGGRQLLSTPEFTPPKRDFYLSLKTTNVNESSVIYLSTLQISYAVNMKSPNKKESMHASITISVVLYSI